MSEIIDFYQQQAQDGLSNIPWLAQMQSSAMTQLARSGFPVRQDEEWKYTSLDALLKQPFAKPGTVIASKDSVDVTTYPHPTSRSLSAGSNSLETSMDPADKPRDVGVWSVCKQSGSESALPVKGQLSLTNGLISSNEQLASQLPAGVLVLPMSDALLHHEELVKPYLGAILQQEHGIHSLNTAMIQCGVFIYIPAGVCIEDPVVLSHFQDKQNQAVHLRHLIVAEADSQATFIEDYRGEEQISYFTNTVTEISVAAGAKITHYKIQREGKSSWHLGHLSVKQFANSQFSSHSLSLGGKLVRSDISIYLQEEYAQCLMNGLYLPGEGQHVDHHTTVHHLVPHCRSDQDYKGILTGRSRAVFNGKVIVAKNAQHTDARQQNKNLLLSENAEIDSKPQLEIFADDVLCAHGATVGQLDEEALFYLATRGIGRQEASRYLIQAFAHDNLRLIPHRELASWMGNLVTQDLV